MKEGCAKLCKLFWLTVASLGNSPDLYYVKKEIIKTITMEVIFTHPMHEHLTLRGTIIEMVTNHPHFKDHFVVQERADYGTGVCYNINPNDDPKFQFVPSAEGALKRAKQIDRMIESLIVEKNSQ